MDWQPSDSLPETKSQPHDKPTPVNNRKALVAGFAAAVVWFVSVEVVFSVIGRLVDNQSYWSALRAHKLSWVVSAFLALAHGTFVGCVTSSMTHHRAYAVTTVVIIFANVGCLQSIWAHLGSAMVDSGSLSLFWPIIFVVLPILSLSGAFIGACLAQSTKQRRRVRVQ
ncbi:MAG TPA: hypothetical protein VGB77_00170 [Abditibacteriaceae bacterium]|jgi:hypothetical protein